MLRHFFLMDLSDVSGKTNKQKNQPICVAFAFVPAKPPLGRVRTALLMACCSLQQELGAWCHAEGTSYVSGITMDAEGVGWSPRYFLPSLGFLDAVVPHAVVSTASKAPVGLGSRRAVELWARLLLRITRCGVRSKRGCGEVRPVGTGGIGVTWDGSGNVGLSRGKVFLAGVTCSRAGVSPENQTRGMPDFSKSHKATGSEDSWVSTRMSGQEELCSPPRLARPRCPRLSHQTPFLPSAEIG